MANLRSAGQKFLPCGIWLGGAWIVIFSKRNLDVRIVARDGSNPLAAIIFAFIYFGRKYLRILDVRTLDVAIQSPQKSTSHYTAVKLLLPRRIRLRPTLGTYLPLPGALGHQTRPQDSEASVRQPGGLGLGLTLSMAMSERSEP